MSNIKKLALALIAALALLIAGCSYFSSDTVKIEFHGSKIDFKQNDKISLQNDILIISEGGTYEFSGEAQDIQVLIRSVDNVIIILNDFDIVNDKLMPFNVITNCSVSIQAKAGTQNNIIFSGEAEENCIESKGIIEFAGEGSLYIKGYKGVKADKQVIINSSIQVVTEGDALKGDVINVTGGNLVISSEKDGLQGDYISIEAGSVRITGTSGSSRGIYAKENLSVSGGSITINTNDDGMHSGSSVYINGGSISIISGDDALHAKNYFEMNNGVLTVTNCLEGIESARIAVNGGDINITSSNDGINAVSDNDENADILISGGNITVNAGGDGLDANGSIYINGGVLLVSGSDNKDNNAIDFDNDFVVNGGIIAAAGSKVKAKQASSAGSQCTLMINFADYNPAYSRILLTDSEGSIILSAVFPKAFDCLIVSCPEMTVRSAYYYDVSKAENDNSEFEIYTDSGTYSIDRLSQAILTSQSTWIFSGE